MRGGGGGMDRAHHEGEERAWIECIMRGKRGHG